MEFKDFIKGSWHGISFVFMLSSLAMVVHSLILGNGVVSTGDVIAVFIMSIFLYLPTILLCSGRALKRIELLVRHILRLLLIIGIVLSFATHMNWIRWEESATIILFVVFIAAIYIIGLAVEFSESKKLMDRMNEKLKERNLR
ncbi:MAG: DUF3021 family protein [Defluviitaleaceae bacterium]|nr:DUF3021 family protein [Defluviitaleaceae bacterium]MCL2224921.1 DUF3021 family protein [Defluviitaleaceae bacterium]MCL2262517.1 DUF3021 family protein [Defluviitaleaceae bacterium]